MSDIHHLLVSEVLRSLLDHIQNVLLLSCLNLCLVRLLIRAIFIEEAVIAQYYQNAFHKDA